MDQDQKENEAVPGNLRKLLAVAVRSVQWTYAICWSISPTQQGVLKWGDGYYNGVVKRQTHQPLEVVKAGKMCLRSKQLRELYESLSEGDYSEEEKDSKPCRTSLSLEDLSDIEWFYMMCMSFVFPSGKGLPGRALALDQTIWLCNAQYANRRVFSRSLLAKSASVQTVVCFPYLGGIVELGNTELVSEDPALILRVKTILLELSKPNCYAKYDAYKDLARSSNAISVAEDTILEDQEMSLDGPSEESEDDFDVGSTDYCSFTTDVRGSMSSSNCVSKVLERSTFNINKPKSGNANALEPHDNKNCTDLHYKRAISAVLGNSNLLTGCLACGSCVHRSSFVVWRNVQNVTTGRPVEQQKILKKMLFAVPSMYNQLAIPRDEVVLKLEDDRLFALKHMIHSAGINKASVLDDTIKYVRVLEARLGELESNIENISKLNDTVDQTSEDSERKTSKLKRKVCESDVENSLKVEIMEKEVLIEISCAWREYILLDIMDALNRLHLDAHSVQSSTQDDESFTLKVNAKFRGMESTSTHMLKQAIWECIF